MPLVVRPVEHADVAQCVALRVASLGSLVIGRPPPYPGYVQESEASVRNDLDNRPFVHHLKVVDPENETEVMAYGKWEVYPDGRPDLEKLRKPMDQADKEVDHYGLLREAAHDYFCTRNGEMGKRPHILLALLVTGSQYRRQGAGSLIVKWGIELSESTGLPCYLQASEQGRRLYSHYGFQELDSVEFDLSKYGLTGVERMTEMLRIPESGKEPGVATGAGI
ncbi:hypothetical protein BR93DRAFT_940938 [Coniochaeta sp. PMI_546]|nr:hypothetical protein BR93DRAFT_940938 [Coniochaeta sp. PMI_546]